MLFINHNKSFTKKKKKTWNWKCQYLVSLMFSNFLFIAKYCNFIRIVSTSFFFNRNIFFCIASLRLWIWYCVNNACIQFHICYCHVVIYRHFLLYCNCTKVVCMSDIVFSCVSKHPPHWKIYFPVNLLNSASINHIFTYNSYKNIILYFKNSCIAIIAIC